MSEIDLIQADYGAISLAYTTANWWLTISMALVVATYFAGRHIPAWLLVVVLILYLLTAVSVIFELHAYSNLALDYGERLAALRGGKQIIRRGPLWGLDFLNANLNYAIIILASISAAGYAYVTWRSARNTALTGNG